MRHTQCVRTSNSASYVVLHRIGFSVPAQIAPRGGGLLPRLFTLTAFAAVCFLLHYPYTRPFGRVSRPFKRNPALWCPDFPPADEPRANVRRKLSMNNFFLFLADKYRRVGRKSKAFFWGENKKRPNRIKFGRSFVNLKGEAMPPVRA